MSNSVYAWKSIRDCVLTRPYARQVKDIQTKRLIIERFRVYLYKIFHGSLARFWCAYGKIHVKIGILHALPGARVA